MYKKSIEWLENVDKKNILDHIEEKDFRNNLFYHIDNLLSMDQTIMVLVDLFSTDLLNKYLEFSIFRNMFKNKTLWKYVILLKKEEILKPYLKIMSITEVDCFILTKHNINNINELSTKEKIRVLKEIKSVTSVKIEKHEKISTEDVLEIGKYCYIDQDNPVFKELSIVDAISIICKKNISLNELFDNNFIKEIIYNFKITFLFQLSEKLKTIYNNLAQAPIFNYLYEINITVDDLQKHINRKIVDKKVVNSKTLTYAYEDIDEDLKKEGWELFCPHSKEEFNEIRDWLNSIGKRGKMGPLGIYYDGDDIPDHYCIDCWHSYHALNSNDMGRLGWKVKDGSPDWWASDRTDVSEPNGDYVKYAYLGISYDSEGNVSWWNDVNDECHYNEYVIVKRDVDCTIEELILKKIKDK